MSKARDLADSAQEINILDGKSFLDEDNLASDSATGIASQQSIKAYVDGITTTNITSTGALNSGSITSGFGNINNGSSTITTTGAITGGSFVIGSADINENDLESIDGITAGTVSASKAVVVNTNKDITGFRNITATGTISGTLSGSLSSTTTATTQAESDDSTKIATTAYVVDKITTLIGGAPSTLNDLNELAAAINDDANYNSTLTTALATKLPLAGGTMTGNIAHAGNFTLDVGGELILDADTSGTVRLKDGGSQYGTFFTLSSNFYIKSQGNDKDIIFQGNDSSGSGFTALTLDMSAGGTAYFADDVRLTDNHAIRLGTDGDIVFYHDNSNGYLENGTGNLTLDASGVITIDADNGGNINLKDGGTHYGTIQNENSDLRINSIIQDKDIIFRGNDGGTGINALTLDMSAAGRATFNNNVVVTDNNSLIAGSGDDLQITYDGSNGEIDVSSGDLTLDVAGNITLDADGGNVRFKDGGTEYGTINKNGANLSIYSSASNADMQFHGNDNGTIITALTLDMSDAGHAKFNSNVSLVDNAKLNIGTGADLQIYHDGSNSYVTDQGTGQLVLLSNSFRINNAANTENMISAEENGAVSLFFNDSSKLATTSSGVSVTGTVAATSYTGDGSNLTGVGGSTAYGAVGTYIWAHNNTNTLTHNTTIAGSNLTALGAITAGQSNVYLYNVTSGSLSGTWRSLGGSNDTRGGHHRCVALFVRIS